MCSMFTLFDAVESIDRPEVDFLSIFRLTFLSLREKTSFSEVPNCIFFGHVVGVHFNLGFEIVLVVVFVS